MRHSLLPRFLLIFALLFAQMGGIAHGISHTLTGHNSEQSLPHDQHCDLCGLYAQIGSALGSSHAPFITTDTHHTPYLALFAPPASATFFAYAARAPPYSL